ncbi:ficolin-2-like [Asterias rubens]|uniref:ficolin-2-like n=1 Tax=Asterias rubens TaxID=7604 RepID=UPI001455124E|nr:ficolin-2-like [Asterias rubens]
MECFYFKTFFVLTFFILNTKSQMDHVNDSGTPETSTSSENTEDNHRGAHTQYPMDGGSVVPPIGGSVTGMNHFVNTEAQPPGREQPPVEQRTEQAPEDKEPTDTGRFVCQPHITIHPPPASTNSGTCCNCSTIRDIISSELARFFDSCRQVQGRDNTERQLEQLHTAVSDLAVVLKAFQRPGAPLPASLAVLPKDCSEVQAKGATNSGVYVVQPLDFARSFRVYCDMETDGGGWTVFQRRQDGTVDFDRNFASYRRGFGDQEGEFWLGNDNLHRMTAQDEYELRVDLTDFEDESAFAVYDLFRVGDVTDNYRLTLGEYSGTAGDAMANHNNQPFTTKDRDNDNWGTKNCAKEYHSAWWHNSCYYASLNGDYLGGTTGIYGKGVLWYQWKGYYYSLKTSEMKFRMKN